LEERKEEKHDPSPESNFERKIRDFVLLPRQKKKKEFVAKNGLGNMVLGHLLEVHTPPSPSY